jgi:hypothetical protein
MSFRQLLVQESSFERTAEQNLYRIPHPYQSYRSRSDVELTGVNIIAQCQKNLMVLLSGQLRKTLGLLQPWPWHSARRDIVVPRPITLCVRVTVYCHLGIPT